MIARRHRYRAHGLTIESEIELPELIPFDGEPDVTVRYGDVPARLEGPVFRGRDYQTANGDYLLNVPHAGRYLVRGGRSVTVAPADAAPASSVRGLILSSVMGALAHQRGLLPLHASTVQIGNGAILFAGEPRAGKSTLAAAVHGRGYRLVSDDLSLLTLDASHRIVVHEGGRRVRLFPDALDHVGAALGDRRPVTLGPPKYSADVRHIEGPPTVPVTCVVHISSRDAPAIELIELARHRRVAALVRDTYRRGIVVALGRRAAHFEQCLAFAPRIPVFALSRPRGLDHIETTIDRIITRLRAFA